MWGEAALCIAFPLAMMPLLYIVQGHRYDIYESIGCSIPFFFSWPGVALRFFVPMACSLVSLIYAGEPRPNPSCMSRLSFLHAALAIRWFLVRRLQFRTILASSSSGLSVSRYLRLIALAVTDVTILIVNDVIGIAVSFIVLPVKHYPSFSKVHHDFSLISQFPEEYVPPLTHSTLVFTLYNAPLYSIVFFIFFGLGEEAVAEYTLLGAAVFSFLKRLGMIKHRYV